LLVECAVGYGWGGKYAPAAAVLPGTLLGGIRLGMVGIAQTYLWCAERAGRGCLAMIAGMPVVVALSFVLIPRFGLAGAVGAAALGALAVVTVVLFMCRHLGLRTSKMTWLLVALPASLPAGGVYATAVVLITCWIAWRSEALLTRQEKTWLVETVGMWQARLGSIGKFVRIGGFGPIRQAKH